MVTEFFDIHKQPPKLQGRAALICWLPLPDGVYKVNFDAALFGNLGMVGIGVVVRDSVGEIIVALS